MYKTNIFALSLIIFLHTKVAWGCYSYKCQGTASYPSYTCSSVSTNSSTTLDIFTCPVNTNLGPYYCDANGGTTEQCDEGMTPGSPASVADVCLSGQIKDGYCRGSLLGESYIYIYINIYIYIIYVYILYLSIDINRILIFSKYTFYIYIL